MSGRVLSTRGADRTAWLDLLARLPPGQRDIHYHPDYMRIYELTYPSDEARLIVLETANGVMFQPVMVRPVPDTDYHDMSSVYGYGGPLCTGTPDAQDRADFAAFFQQHASDTGAVAEFCLLHPMLADAQKALCADGTEFDYRKEVVVADLRKPLSAIWAAIDERQRKAALAARKAGVRVVMSDLSDGDLDAYHHRYLATMQTVGARAFWHFPENYFHNCRDALGAEHVSLFHAEAGGQIIASVFHIHMYDTVYYHFSCSDPDARKLNGTTLLLLDSLIWAHAQGFSWFHMGGGRTDEDDPLYRFKVAFSGQTLPLFSTRRILDRSAYDALTHAVKEQEIRKTGAPRQTDFFPRYRLQT
ncbi:GNAT family N-acetyltransferase [Roseobacter ponti]|uniref:GNAT family N-acetyltransferase n=1 Tax=Roseobacter ponti TaxID=1891787 RepID=A0A858SVW1_9RHOB|nr:GNAT family N-acetyltransferase [Roseobacter ponti]QJF52884.1 GNAT family N-acetyltransferase [Roseobacter ponti]